MNALANAKTIKEKHQSNQMCVKEIIQLTSKVLTEVKKQNVFIKRPTKEFKTNSQRDTGKTC